MNCPKCTTLVTKPGRFCAACGNDFGEELSERIEYYFGLKEEFKSVAALQNNLASGLKDLLRRIETYEGLLDRDLAESVVKAAEIQPPEVHESEPTTLSPSGMPVSVAKGVEPGDTEPESQPVSPRPVYTHAPGSKRGSTEFEIHVGQKWLLIVGILTMVFGVGYFLKYSFEQGWVGPAGRVAMAYLWGIAFLVVGDRFRAKNLERFGLPLIGGGIAVLYFSTFAAFQLYHLFDQTASFSIMVLITVLACTLAVYYDTKWLAVMGLIGGFLTPVLLSTGQDNQIALMTYMTVLNLGLLGVAFYKKWDLLNTLGLIFTYLLYSAWHVQHYQDSKFWPAILFLNVFYLIYTFVPFTYQVRKGGRSDERELVLMGINAFIAFGYGFFMIRGLYGVAWVSVITIFYASVFLSMATYLSRKGMQSLDVFVVLLAKSMLFLIITIPVLFSGHWITVFWSAQGLVLVWMAVKLERRSLAAGGYALLLVSVLKFLLHDYSEVFHVNVDYWFAIRGGYAYLILERLMTTAFLLITTAAAGIFAKRAPGNVRVSESGDVSLIFLAFGIVLFIALTIETSSFFYDYLLQARFAATSVLWTLFSVVLMLIGFRMNSAAVRKISFGLFLFVALKVFLFDMSNFSTPYRIISFIILGLVLVCTSYLYYRYKDRIITALADDEKAKTQG
jgi:uncharacterized membrane protein